MRNFQTLSEAYLEVLRDIFDNPDSTSAPRGQAVREKFNYQFTVIEPKPDPIVTLDEERNKVIAEYSQKEFDLYESCSNKVEDFMKASKFWGKLANPDRTVNSAYGYLIWKYKSHGNGKFEQCQIPHPAYKSGVTLTSPKFRTPWEWAKESLIADKDTRQAILRFSLPEHQWMGNKDQTCTLHGYFQIRANLLSLTITMRSNDMTLGLVYDLPWFVSLIYKMRDELLPTYPDLKIGTYTHYVHNIHVYDRDEDKILKMLGRSDG